MGAEPTVTVVLFEDDSEVSFILRREHLLFLQEEAGRPGDPGVLPDGLPPGAVVMVGNSATARDAPAVLATFILALRQLNDLAVQEALSRCHGAILLVHPMREGGYAVVGAPFATQEEFEEGLPGFREHLGELRATLDRHALTAPRDDRVHEVDWEAGEGKLSVAPGQPPRRFP